MTWGTLPAGQTITLTPGANYAAVVSVAASHTQASLLSAAARRGLQVYDYAEQTTRPAIGSDPNYPSSRYVAIAAHATAPGTIPWTPGFPASLVAHYSIVSAWEDPTPTTIGTTPSGATPTPPPSQPARFPKVSAIALSLIAIGAGAWAWSHR